MYICGAEHKDQKTMSKFQDLYQKISDIRNESITAITEIVDEAFGRHLCTLSSAVYAKIGEFRYTDASGQTYEVEDIRTDGRAISTTLTVMKPTDAYVKKNLKTVHLYDLPQTTLLDLLLWLENAVKWLGENGGDCVYMYGQFWRPIPTTVAETALKSQISVGDAEDGEEKASTECIWWRVLSPSPTEELWMNNCDGENILLTNGDTSYYQVF